MKPLHACRFYTFIDTAYTRGRPPEDLARQLCDGGSDIIQLRAKNSSPSDILRLAEQILPITQAAGVPLVINDHPQIAARSGAPFCHLGQEDFFDSGLTRVQQLLAKFPAHPNRPPIQIGLSTHAPAQAIKALNAAPDYIAIGPVFATGTKPTAAPVTLDYVRWAAANVPIPWFAIGGITLQNVENVLAAGARRICVVSAILNAPNITQACHQFRNRLSFAP